MMRRTGETVAAGDVCAENPDCSDFCDDALAVASFAVGTEPDLRNVMFHTNRSIATDRRLLLLKWLMIVIPPVTVAVGHVLLRRAAGQNLPGHAVSTTEALLVTSFVTLVALVLGYVFVETLFRVLRRLQAEALAREQDMLTMNAVMRERERLSRELHDGAAQLVAHLLLRLDTIKELVESDRPREAGAELERLHGIADEIYQDIGESIAGLRTNVREGGVICAIQDYVDQFEERYQIPTHLRTDDTADELSPLAALQVFRFIQEALTNVRKHAGARDALVTLMSSGPDQLQVIIADDGRGFIPAASGVGPARPLGLTSMRERVESLGGTFQVESQPGSGTRVTATVPMPRTRGESRHAVIATPLG